MKKDKLLLVCVSLFILGGVMGLITSLIPEMEHFNYRYIITGTSTYGTSEKPLYAIIYSIIMALFEMSFLIIFFCYSKTIMKYIMMVIVINLLGCIIAIILGDQLAILSLLLRIIFLSYIIFVYNKSNYEVVL